MFISCKIGRTQKTNFNLLQNNNCHAISCDNNWKNIQKLVVLNRDNSFICVEKNECSNFNKYLIEEKKICVDDCKQYPDFPYEFQNKCYKSCPLNISEISSEKDYYCEVKCPKDLPYEIIESQKCVNNCTTFQISNKLCKLNYKSNNKNEENEAKEKMVQNIQEEIANGIVTSNIDKGKDIIIQESDITITITKNDNQKNEIDTKTNTTSIDLGDCETELKTHYNISQYESLYILKMDLKQEGYQIPKIQYEVHYPLNNDSKLTLLNLTICDNIDIDIYFPITLNGNLAQNDPNSAFYNDICNTYTSEDGKDLTLSARKKNYINNKLTVCEENCEFTGYNKTTEKAKCSCKVKTDFVNKISENNFNEIKLYEIFTDFNNIFNIRVLKCMNLIFTIKAFKENYANIILVVIITLFYICLFVFIFRSYNHDIKYYVNAIIYFTLFPIKILYIIKKLNKQERKKKMILLNMIIKLRLI